MSTSPNASDAPSATRAAPMSVPRSPTTAAALPGAEAIAPQTSAARWGSRPWTITAAPSAARDRAMAAPIPLVLPVTRAVWPLSWRSTFGSSPVDPASTRRSCSTRALDQRAAPHHMALVTLLQRCGQLRSSGARRQPAHIAAHALEPVSRLGASRRTPSCPELVGDGLDAELHQEQQVVTGDEGSHASDDLVVA